MIKFALLLLVSVYAAATPTAEPEGQLWGVLVAGSSGFYNYRHQADVCHAYHVLSRHGIPDERIVVMMYDDIAHNTENPIKGKVFNHLNGSDVYAGVPKDYTNELVTPENFMKVLLGEKPEGGTGKVLASGPKDHVFVNFVDHGAPGILGFPSSELTAKDFLRTLQQMNEKNKYAQMVLYIEACESGSMFHRKLPNNTNVYATTAANPKESSYACYFDNKVGTYLGDVYSVKWMEDSDKENIDSETLRHQYERVKAETNTSHVMQYGQLAMSREHVGEFQGDKEVPQPIHYPTVSDKPVPSREVPLVLQQTKIAAAKSPAEKEQLEQEFAYMLKKRSFVRSLFKRIALESTADKLLGTKILSVKHDLTDLDCHDTVVKHFSKNCLAISKNPYVLQQIQIFVNMCEEQIPAGRITRTIDTVCENIPSAIENVV